MPVEIHELIVKINLEENKTKTSLQARELQELKKQIIKECTEKIMNKLETISDR
jgi:hypothetical protein